jgi:hypothetical protein
MCALLVAPLALSWSVAPLQPTSLHNGVTRCISPRCNLAEAAGYLEDIPQGAPDAILGIAAAFRASAAPNKVNLAVGAYRDDGGSPYVLPSVREAENRLLARGEKKEYAPIDGLPNFKELALQFAYGEDCAALKEGRIASVQTLSGTGACRIAGAFYSRFLPKGTAVYVSDPSTRREDDLASTTCPPGMRSHWRAWPSTDGGGACMHHCGPSSPTHPD